MLRRLFSLTVLSVTIMLTGCATTVKQSAPASPSSASTATTTPNLSTSAQDGTIAVVLLATPEVKGSGDWVSFTEEWRSAVAEAASDQQAIAKLVETEADIAQGTTLLIRIKVNEFRYVSTGRRFMLGVIAGNAYMDIDVEYAQLPSRKIFGSKKINTTSSAWEGIFSGVTPRQVEAVSQLIVKDAQAGGSSK